MAKNSIGQFLAALRKANGLTQQEVADRLNVSNKAVSRWERDECCPDLTLIPALAEMFGVTCDELLRGERSAPGDASCEERTERQKARADKQFAVLLRGRMRKYKNLTLLSVGLAICGLLSAAVADLAFSQGLIAFILAAAFGTAGEICQLCFARNSFILSDGETEEHAAELQRAASEVVETAVRVTFLNIALVAFCLPPAALIDGTNFGLAFKSWLMYGLLFSGAALALAYIAYTLFVRGRLTRRGLLTCGEEERETFERNRRLLVKTAAVSLGVAAILWAGAAAFYNMVPVDALTEKELFSSCEDFKVYVESGYDAWFAELTAVYDAPPVSDPLGDTSVWPMDPEHQEYQEYKVYNTVENKSGEVICSYYYNPELYFYIRFADSQDRTPITVVTKEAYDRAWELKSRIEAAIYCLIVLDLAAAAGIYLLKIRRKKGN